MHLDIKEIADKADLIVNGYAYTKDKGYIRVICNDKIVEANMDDIESQIVLDYYFQDKEFIEEKEYA